MCISSGGCVWVVDKGVISSGGIVGVGERVGCCLLQNSLRWRMVVNIWWPGAVIALCFLAGITGHMILSYALINRLLFPCGAWRLH